VAREAEVSGEAVILIVTIQVPTITTTRTITTRTLVPTGTTLSITTMVEVRRMTPDLYQHSPFVLYSAFLPPTCSSLICSSLICSSLICSSLICSSLICSSLICSSLICYSLIECIWARRCCPLSLVPCDGWLACRCENRSSDDQRRSS